MDEEITRAWDTLCTALFEVGVTTALVSMVIPDQPEHVKENFLEKLRATIHVLTTESAEYQEFAEAFDGKEDPTD